MNLHSYRWQHPHIGSLVFIHDSSILYRISFAKPDAHFPDEKAPSFLEPALNWLNIYAESPLKVADAPLKNCPRALGTPFQEKVWEALHLSRPGETFSYQSLATQAGFPAKNARAVAGAMARNPFVILIPCHRVLRRSGELGGYSAGDGIETKKNLLRHEGIYF
ncbi:MAG: methylated-DNA--[protein]-cysteine S-methyltransferase [Pseudomonadota bacterium]